VSETTLAEARLGLRKMLGINLKRKLNYTIYGLLIPPDAETTVQKVLLATLQVSPTSDVAITNITSGANVFRGQVTWWVEPMLGDASTTTWYAFARPDQGRAIRFCFQQGFENMASRDYYNPKNNCRIYQFEGRFAAAVGNYRAVYKNAGA